jgi:leucyl/phenylalanyl-tRNA--protein transferase
MVLYPDEFKCSRSLAKRIKNAAFTVKLDSAFTQVVQRCAATPRAGQDGTWIQPEIVAAYTALHELGFAHSVESWQDGELVGGLYGIHLGQMFFGESMFAHRTDASKVALARLVDVLTGMGVELIDCQQATRHLASLGARPIPRQRFAEALTGLIKFPVQPTSWAQCEGYAR